jgi:phosphate transport system protein
MKPLEGHISKALDGALGALHLHVVAMGSLALDQVRSAARAYVHWDRRTAEIVLEREQAVNAYDHALDAEQLMLLARRQPLASDLKFVLAFSKAVAELERVGDEAKKIARFVITDEAPAGEGATQDVGALAQLAESSLRLALEAFDALDPSIAASVIAADQGLDARYHAALERLLAKPQPDARHMRQIVHAAFVLKALERIGDHAVNVVRLLQD